MFKKLHTDSDRHQAPRRLRVSPALVVSVIALILALGGTGYAAVKLPANSVGGKQLKKNAVTGVKVKNHSLTGADLNLSALGTVPSAKTAGDANHAASADHATNADQLGGAGAGSYQRAARWALVANGGQILDQSGGVSVDHSVGSHTYDVYFGSSVAGHPIIASLAGAVAGQVSAYRCGGGPGGVTCANDSPSHVVVVTYNGSGVALDHSFNLTVL